MPQISETLATPFLKSPITEKTQRLQPMRVVVARPYFGAKKRLRFFRTLYTVGKSTDCDIVLDDPFVSPLHAKISLLPGGEGYLVEDLSSTNGTFLNGIRVKMAPLPAHGILRFGRSSLSWAQEEVEDPAQLMENGWIVADPFMREMVSRLRNIAESNLPVLLLGETGTGKEIFARLLHQWSTRARAPYVPVNGALTGGNLAESELFGHTKGAFTGADLPRKGALRAAHGGTLFLDEVADMPTSAQVKLLRALESGEVKSLGSDEAESADFRLVTATSQDLGERISENRFRLDLYYRIAGFTLVIPPLRDRPQDTLAIAKKYLGDKGMELDIESEGKLLSYRWPGNVRELRSCLERATTMARGENLVRVMPKHLGQLGNGSPLAPAAKAPKPLTLLEMEQECIRASLERNGWSRSVASKELGIARSTLFLKMRRYGFRDANMVNS
jgi:DNA-binding NtrC family response regulator